MASKASAGWTQDSLISAVEAVRSSKLSLRKASLQYGIPKSTLSLYVAGKLKVGAKCGPTSILTAEEEQKLVDYVVHMSKIGYGCTRDQLLEIVHKMVVKDGRKNPFTNDKPVIKWWTLFKKRHPEVSLRIPEQLQVARAKCCTPETLQAWFNSSISYCQ